MMSSQHLKSNAVSSSYEMLHQSVKHWVYKQNWKSLRFVQEKTIPHLIKPSTDVLVCSGTASGKTEAAFLPIISYLLENPDSLVLYISPLKALINDQYNRLSDICEYLHIPVTPYHGDVPINKKKQLFDKRRGILIITPESLESLFVNKGGEINSLSSNIKYIVIDEIHSFIGSERGKQLQSQIYRIEQVNDNFIPRVGLSATIGEPELATKFLRYENSNDVEIIDVKESGRELKILLHGIDKTTKAISESGKEIEVINDVNEISDILFKKLYNTNNLIFPNSREKVEEYCSYLTDLCEAHHMVNRFFPHHGSLSKDIREYAEDKIKSSSANIIATTTLELGIDIGSVESIAQIGSPPSVASLRQRIGRSGRNGSKASILRGFTIEQSGIGDISEYTKQNTLQIASMIMLMCEGWVESPIVGSFNYSTFIQQLLSVISQYGGVKALSLWRMLIEKGAFPYIIKEDFFDILKKLGNEDIVYQTDNGIIYLGKTGEAIVNNYKFYTAFKTDIEYRIVLETKTLGTIPLSKQIFEGQCIIFAGKKLNIIEIDDDNKIILVNFAKGGEPTSFFGNGFLLNDVIRAKMKSILINDYNIPFLDAKSKSYIDSARSYAHKSGLFSKIYDSFGGAGILFTWKGDRVNETIAFFLMQHNIIAVNNGFYIEITIDESSLYDKLRELYEMKECDFLSYVDRIPELCIEKWDFLLPRSLQVKSYAQKYFDFEGTKIFLKHLLNK